MNDPAAPESPEAGPGCLMPGLWLTAAALVTVLCVAAVGLTGASSESAGVAASNFASLPLGFVCVGAPVALGVHFLVKRGVARIVAPLGCGCLGAVGFFLGLTVFYAAIWPSL